MKWASCPITIGGRSPSGLKVGLFNLFLNINTTRKSKSSQGNRRGQEDRGVIGLTKPGA